VVKHLHKYLNLDQDDVLILKMNVPAHVSLMDDANYQCYLNEEEYEYYEVPGKTDEYFVHETWEYKLTSYDLPMDDYMNSGVYMTEYYIKNEDTGVWVQDWTKYTKPFDLTEFGEGKYSIHFRTYDNLMHEEPIQSFIVQVDNTGPNKPDINVGTPSWVDVDTNYIWVNTGNMKTPFTITNLVDPSPSKAVLSSGVVKVEYKIDDEVVWNEVTGTFDFSKNDREHTIYARATDKVGNIGEVQSRVIDSTDNKLKDTVRFDSTPPATEITTFSVSPGEKAGTVDIEWAVGDYYFDHFNLYEIPENSDEEWIATLDKKETQYLHEDAEEGRYKYRIAPADEVENEAKGKTSEESVMVVSNKARTFDVVNKMDTDEYVRIEFTQIDDDKQIYGAKNLMGTLPDGVPMPTPNEDYTFWEIYGFNPQPEPPAATRGRGFTAKLFFSYGQFHLTADMEEYVRVARWDGNKWTDMAISTDPKEGVRLNEVMVQTTHFSTFAVVRASSDLGIDVSVKNNPMLSGTQNIISATITNYGKSQGKIFNIDEEGANITFEVLTEGGWDYLGYRIVDIPAGETRDVEMVWDGAEVAENIEVRVRMEPRDSKTESNDDNNYASEKVEVVSTDTVTTSFVTNIVLLGISAAMVVALSRIIKRRR